MFKVMRGIVFFVVVLLLVGCSFHKKMEISPLALSWYSLKGYPARESSYDRTGGNTDAIRIMPGETVTIADIEGPGIIRHIWTTTNAEGPIGKELWSSRMYWDGSETPSVEVPFGDFFAVGNGEQANVNSWPITNESKGRSPKLLVANAICQRSKNIFNQ